jgi:hypothetical protein
MWLDTYYMRSSMLPTFLSPILADRALVIGKSINFIRLCIQRSPKGAVLSELKAQIKTRGLLPGMPRPSVASALGFGTKEVQTDNEENDDDSDIDDNNDATVMGSTVAYAEVEASLRALRYGSVDSRPDPQEEDGHKGDSEGDSGLKLMELITKISAATDSRLLILMEQRFQLSTHLLALKKFMLLGMPFRRVLFTIKLLHKCFEFLCSLLMPYWLGSCVLCRTCRQNRLFETLFHTVIILSKHHHHHATRARGFCDLSYGLYICIYVFICIHIYVYKYIYMIL